MGCFLISYRESWELKAVCDTMVGHLSAHLLKTLYQDKRSSAH